MYHILDTHFKCWYAT